MLQSIEMAQQGWLHWHFSLILQNFQIFIIKAAQMCILVAHSPQNKWEIKVLVL